MIAVLHEAKSGFIYYSYREQLTLARQLIRDGMADVIKESSHIVKLSNLYQKSILGFLDFLNTMKGKYHEATFLEKRTAFDVLGIKVVIHPDKKPAITEIKTEKEWLTVREAAEAAGIKLRTLADYVQAGTIQLQREGAYPRVIHREELNRFLSKSLVKPRPTAESLPSRIEISYTPIFTDVQSSLDHLQTTGL